MSFGKFAVVAFTSIALGLSAGCGEGHKDEHAKGKAAEEHKDEDLIKLSDAEAARAGLKTETLEEREHSETVDLTATVQPNRERIAHVAPRLPGRIVGVPVKLGDTVKQGQVMATLESIEVGEAYSAYAQAMSEARVARSAFERAERLQAEQIIAGKEYQKARAENEKARVQAEAAGEKLKMLGVSPASASKGAPVSRFPVVAPLSGTVIEREAVLGELAKPEAGLFTVADLSRVWLEANVGEAELNRIRVGSRARARFASLPDEVFEGKVNHVGAVLDKETRTAKAIIELNNRDGRLRPQMFGNVAIDSGSSRKVLSLPESAVTLVQGLHTVFVEEATGFRSLPVELGGRSGGNVIIKSGVKAGESVVTEGVYALKARLLKSQIGSGHAH